MTRLQLLKTIVAIRLLARGEWTVARWMLSRRQKWWMCRAITEAALRVLQLQLDEFCEICAKSRLRGAL